MNERVASDQILTTEMFHTHQEPILNREIKMKVKAEVEAHMTAVCGQDIDIGDALNLFAKTASSTTTRTTNDCYLWLGDPVHFCDEYMMIEDEEDTDVDDCVTAFGFQHVGRGPVGVVI